MERTWGVQIHFEFKLFEAYPKAAAFPIKGFYYTSYKRRTIKQVFVWTLQGQVLVQVFLCLSDRLTDILYAH